MGWGELATVWKSFHFYIQSFFCSPGYPFLCSLQFHCMSCFVLVSYCFSIWGSHCGHFGRLHSLLWNALRATNYLTVALCNFRNILQYFKWCHATYHPDFACLLWGEGWGGLYGIVPFEYNFFNINLFIYLFIYFWLHWVFIAAHGLSLVAASGGYSSSQCAGFSVRWLLLLRSSGSRLTGFSSCGTRAL